MIDDGFFEFEREEGKGVNFEIRVKFVEGGHDILLLEEESI